MPSKSRRSSTRRGTYVPDNSHHNGSEQNGHVERANGSVATASRPDIALPHHQSTPISITLHPEPNGDYRSSTNGVDTSLLITTNEATALSENGERLWSTSDSGLVGAHLSSGASHSLRLMTSRRSRSGLWSTLALIMLAAALTVALLMVVGGQDRNHAEMRATVFGAATVAAQTVDNSASILESLRSESSFTPELVASISALGDASRDLVESVSALPTDDPASAELRMTATSLAGRVSRLGETFGAAFSYRGQIEPLLTFPSLDDPLDISSLSENTNLLTDWQFRLEQAASAQPSQPRLLQNQEALGAMLPYIAVHRQAFVDAVGNDQAEQASAALSQIRSFLSALRQDFDRAYDEIAEIAQMEIQSLSADLQVLSKGI